MPEATYYTILGIRRDASQHQIKIAYRKIARKHNQDDNNNRGAGPKIEAANAAYDVLRDPIKRAAYDWSMFRTTGDKSEAAQKAAPEAGPHARHEAQQKAAAETEEREKREAQQKAAAETEEREKREAQQKAAAETEEREKREAEQKAIQGVLYTVKEKSFFTFNLKAFHIFIVSNKVLPQAACSADKDDKIKKCENARAQLISQLAGSNFFSKTTLIQSFSIAIAFCIITLILGIIHHYNWIYVSLVGTLVVWRASYLSLKKIKLFYVTASSLSVNQKKSILRSTYLMIFISIPSLFIALNYSLLWLFLLVPLLISIWELSYKFLLKASDR